MEGQFSIRINLSAKEFELTGSEEFIETYYNKLSDMIKSSGIENHSDGAASLSESKIREKKEAFFSFENLLNKFSEKSVTNTDKILITGYYMQLKYKDGFYTKDVKNLLLDYGIKIENPSQLIKNSINTNKIISVGRGKFKVSQNGEKYIKGLLPDLFGGI